jgi:hypothetical protein
VGPSHAPKLDAGSTDRRRRRPLGPSSQPPKPPPLPGIGQPVAIRIRREPRPHGERPGQGKGSTSAHRPKHRRPNPQRPAGHRAPRSPPRRRSLIREPARGSARNPYPPGPADGLPGGPRSSTSRSARKSVSMRKATSFPVPEGRHRSTSNPSRRHPPNPGDSSTGLGHRCRHLRPRANPCKPDRRLRAPKADVTCSGTPSMACTRMKSNSVRDMPQLNSPTRPVRQGRPPGRTARRNGTAPRRADPPPPAVADGPSMHHRRQVVGRVRHRIKSHRLLEKHLAPDTHPRPAASTAPCAGPWPTPGSADATR